MVANSNDGYMNIELLNYRLTTRNTKHNIRKNQAMENSTKSSTASSDDANNAKKELSFSGKSAIGTMVQGITDLATATTIKTDDTTDNTGTTFGNEDKKFRFLYKLKICF